VVFHDDTLARAVDGAGLNAAPAAALLAEAGLDIRTATIQQMTYAQLRSFHLGGHPGVHIPSLRDFLRRGYIASTCNCAHPRLPLLLRRRHVYCARGNCERSGAS